MQTMTAEQREQAFAMANQEMEYRVDLFNKLVHSCYEKCIDKRFKDGDLNVGETACVDRCSSKYWQSVGIVGQLLGANQQQQQQPWGYISGVGSRRSRFVVFDMH